MCIISLNSVYFFYNVHCDGVVCSLVYYVKTLFKIYCWVYFFIFYSCVFYASQCGVLFFLKMKFEEVHQKFEELNTGWIGLLFCSYESFFSNIRDEQVDLGHRYHFKNAKLNTRLGVPYVCSGETCGDNGGKTQKNTPCRFKGTNNGRCKRHPPPSHVPKYDVNHVFSWVTVDFGDDALIRPLGGMISWAMCNIYIGIYIGISVGDDVFVPMDLLSEKVLHIPESFLWDKYILNIKDVLCLPQEAKLNIEGKIYEVDPLWTVDYFIEKYSILDDIYIGDKKLKKGYKLSDYGVSPETTVLASDHLL